MTKTRRKPKFYVTTRRAMEYERDELDKLIEADKRRRHEAGLRAWDTRQKHAKMAAKVGKLNLNRFGTPSKRIRK